MGFVSGLFGGGGSSSPVDVPDFESLLKEQARINRIDTFTPFGNVQFSGPDKTVGRLTLTPEQQALLNRAIGSAVGHFPQVGSGQQVAGDIFSSFQNRIQPEFDQRRSRLQEQLTQSGNPAVGADLAPGAVSELDLLGRQENDAMIQAFLEAQGIGGQQRLAEIQGNVAFQDQLTRSAATLAGGQPISPSMVDVTGAQQLLQNAQSANAKARSDKQAAKNQMIGQIAVAAIGGI